MCDLWELRVICETTCGTTSGVRRGTEEVMGGIGRMQRGSGGVLAEVGQ